MKKRVSIVLVVCVSALIAFVAGIAGDLDPPGPPGSAIAKMKTLNQLEPRTAILSLPYEITNSGAYYLVASLDGTPGSNGIIIAVDDVQVDLHGFSMRGGSNSLNGIFVPASNELHNILIRNGAVIEWGQAAIQAPTAFDSTVSRIKMYKNGGNGILLGNHALVEECDTIESGGTGISVGDASTISDCKSMDNGKDGIKAGVGCRIHGSLAAGNWRNGMDVDIYSTIKECLAGKNYTNGIVISFSCLVVNNNCGDNGKTNNCGAGILVNGRGNRIVDNNLTANWCGIELSNGGNRVEGNNVIDNSSGIRDLAGGNLIIRNSVGGGSITNFDVSSASQYGAILRNLGPGFTNTNPWANFELPDP